MTKPKKWTEVYPYGTKEGDEESRFFKAIARHQKYDYRSIGAIMKDSKLSRDRVEEILDKYVNRYDPPLVYQHPTNEDHWGYWERCENDLKSDFRSISQKDQDKRVDKHLQGASMTGGKTCDCGPDSACSNCP